MEFNLKNILRALLQSTSEPLAIKDIQTVITRYHKTSDPLFGKGDGATEEEGRAEEPGDGQELMTDLIAQVPTLLTGAQIRDAMGEIAQELEDTLDVCRLQEGPNGYRLMVSPDYAVWVRLLRNEPRPQRLSQAAMETLAIIAYRQPATRAEIEAIRGVSADNAVNRLLDKELIHVMGRADLPGRPIQYGTTDKFLEFCGLKSIEELPASDVLSPNQITEWIRRASHQDKEISDADVGLQEEAASQPADAPEEAAGSDEG